MRKLWAVAVNTIKQALRIKIANAFVILLAILLPVMGLTMTGDGTIKGRLQSFVSYGLSLTSLLLCLLTIILSVYSLTNDINQKQIYTVLTKPIRRCQLLFGKFLGIVLLDIGLLFLFASTIYAIAVYTPKLMAVDKEENRKLKNEFYTARQNLIPTEADVTQEVIETYKKLERNQQLPEGITPDKIKAHIEQQKKLEKRAAAVGHNLVWKFYNVKVADPNESLFIRFKYDVAVNPPDMSIYSRWGVGDDRPYPPKALIYDRKDSIRTFHELQVPGRLVAEDGYLSVAFLNPPLNDTVVIFPPQDGLELLYKADSFTMNYIKAVILILFRLVFLACLGLLASTFLSFPVAILLCLFIFSTGTISAFVIESFDSLGEDMVGVYSYTLKPVMRLLPQFDKFSPNEFLVSARLLTWPFLAKAAGLMVGIKASLLFGLALLIFSRKEIAKITV